MTTAAEQYRKLVAKLESINPSGPVSEGGYVPAAAQDDATGVDAAAAVQAATASAAPAPATTSEIPTIGGSFKQAYAQAVKQGLKQFKWCGTYSTRRGQGPNPVIQTNKVATPGKVDYTGQSTPLGGDAQNPMSFAPNSNFGA